jgi:hypothetical protein
VKRLEVALYAGSIVDAPVETLAVPIPEDERPLRGNAGFVDWRLGGELSRQLQSGFASGQTGEALLLPSQRPFAAARILLFGLGPAESTGRVLQRAFAVGAAKLLGLRTPLALLALPAAVDVELDGEFLLRGCLQALSASRGDQCLSLVLPDAEKYSLALETVLADVSEEAHRRQVALDVTWIEPEPAALPEPEPEPRGPEPAPDVGIPADAPT